MSTNASWLILSAPHRTSNSLTSAWLCSLGLLTNPGASAMALVVWLGIPSPLSGAVIENYVNVYIFKSYRSKKHTATNPSQNAFLYFENAHPIVPAAFPQQFGESVLFHECLPSCGRGYLHVLDRFKTFPSGCHLTWKLPGARCCE